jgi:hypothetical protein
MDTMMDCDDVTVQHGAALQSQPQRTHVGASRSDSSRIQLMPLSNAGLVRRCGVSNAQPPRRATFLPLGAAVTAETRCDRHSTLESSMRSKIKE